MVGVTYPVLFKGGKMSAISLPKNATLLSMSLSGSSQDLTAEIIYTSGSGIYTMLWKNGASLLTFPKDRTVSSRLIQEDGMCCVLNPPQSALTGLIYRSGELHDMPEGYSCVGSNAICMANGILNVGLSSYDGSAPVVWKDGEIEKLNINGYISTMTAY